MTTKSLLRSAQHDKISEKNYVLADTEQFATMIREMAKRPDSVWLLNPLSTVQTEIRSNGEQFSAFVYGAFAGFANFIKNKDPNYSIQSTSK